MIPRAIWRSALAPRGRLFGRVCRAATLSPVRLLNQKIQLPGSRVSLHLFVPFLSLFMPQNERRQFSQLLAGEAVNRIFDLSQAHTRMQ